MNISQIVPTARSGGTSKIVSARDAVRLIRDGDTIAMGGFVGIGFPEEVAIELEKAFLAGDDELTNLGKPSNLTLVFCAGQGDRLTQVRGLNPSHYTHLS